MEGLKCTICDLPIDGEMVGYGDGTGYKFAHPYCYYRRECAALRARLALLEKVAEEYRFALIFYAAQANYIVAGEGMNWVIADQGARARAALDALKEG